MKVAQHYIDGAWVPGSGTTGTALDPATGEPVSEFAEGTAMDAQAAMAAATRAFHVTSWKHDAKLRSDVLLSAATRLEERREQVAHLLVAHNGKMLREAMGEVAAAISELRYYAGLARNLFGRIIEIEPGCFSALHREAAGVAVIIVPWNAPVTLLVRSLGPALAAGCTVVVKPAHQTALVSNMVLDTVLSDPRLAPGIVNTVTESGAEVSRALCESPEVAVISFTGSTAVGKAIARATAGNLTRLSLELGGKAAAVVFDDCDLQQTVRGVLAGGLILSGQQCTALARVIVHESLFDRFAAELSAAMHSVKPGPGMDAASGMGPLIDRANRDRIKALVEGVDRPADVLVRGEVPGGSLAQGAFITPSLIAVEDLASPLVQNELFGPVMVIERFNDEDDAVARANATRYGLAASVWSRDTGGKARRVANRLRSGSVWLNAHNKLFAEIETGGERDSGYGRLHGAEGMNDFLVTKHVYQSTTV
ncbi:aldehyde dehydrogenase family protein [Variovorax sp. J22P271]|uniref:aldehyde dehydrogenase family protein n=1 Tax=Variovorax davisae TaxID=3053515 RepID=UPI002578FF6D|nr:aldehyde dehydrogenase family protein [Variovorax sp. J22P271]MDM0032033.1 aldehyde dehydrogenase family protein [Variovorax sp. J22P271]